MPAPKSERTELTESATINGEVFDADALFAEFEAKTKTFRFHGEVFAVPAPQLWPDSLGRAEELDEIGRIILGSEPYERYAELGGTVRFLQDLIGTLHGVKMGESSASSTS